MATAGPVVTELPAQEVRFLFGTMMDLRMLPNELKHTGKIAEGEFKIVAHFPAIHQTDGTEANYLARHKTFRGGLYATYQEGPYKIDEIVWDATNRAGVHMLTMTKYGQVVEFPTQPSKTMPGSLKLMVQEYVESLKVPGFVIRCSGLGGALEPKKGTTNEYNVILLSGDVKCPKKLANHVPTKYHAEDESIFFAQVGPWCGNADAVVRRAEVWHEEYEDTNAMSDEEVISILDDVNAIINAAIKSNLRYGDADIYENHDRADILTAMYLVNERPSLKAWVHKYSDILGPQLADPMKYLDDYRQLEAEHSAEASPSVVDAAETGYHSEEFAAASTARADLPREKRNVLSSVRSNYDPSFSWSSCSWGPYFNRYQAEGSNKFYSVWVWERSPGIYTAMGAYGGLGQNPRLFNVGQTRDLQQAVNMAKKKLQSKQKKGYQTYTAEMTQLGDSFFPVIPNTGGGDSALGSGRGVPQWYGAESAFDKLANKVALGYIKKGKSRKEAMDIGRKTAYTIGVKKYGKAGMKRKSMEGRMRKKSAETMNFEFSNLPGLPVVPNDFGESSALASGNSVPQWYGAETFEASFDDYGDMEYIILELLTDAQLEEEYGEVMDDYGIGREDLPQSLEDDYRTADEAEYLREKYLKEEDAETFEAPMPFHSPSKGDVDRVLKSIRARHKGIRMKGSPTYLTERKGGSNKYHVFQMTNRGGFNGYGRIGHTMTVFGPMSPRQYQSKLHSKMKKGYKETGY